MRRAFKLRKKSVSAPYKRISPTQHPETLENPSPLNVNALTPNNIVQLQGVIGNQAVQRLLAAHAPVNIQHHTTPSVQRKPYGLELSDSVGRYTDEAVKLWKTKPTMPIGDFIDTMMGAITQEFKKHGVPPSKWKVKRGNGVDGEFKQDSWTIFIDPNNFSDQTTVKELQDLDKDEVTKVIGTFYHEARHTDQDFLVARMLAGKGKKASEIVAATKIPLNVAEEAVKQKLTSASADSDQIAGAETLFDTMYGEHKELVEFVIKRAGPLQTVKNDALSVDDKSLGNVVKDIKAQVKELENWSKSVLKKKLEVLGKKKTKNALDTQMLNDLTAIDTKLDIVLKAQGTIAKPTIPAVKSFGSSLDALFTVVFDAYNRLANEADAFRVEESAKKEFQRKL